LRLSAGYTHGLSGLKINGDDGAVRDIAGTQIAFQVGKKLKDTVMLGGGLTMHLPNRSMARLAFLPATEPLFVRFDPASQRMTFNAALALRWARLSLGAGASVLASANGQVDLLLGQDANGAFADGGADVRVPYHIAPIVGLALDLGSVGVALRYRGAQGVGVKLDTAARVDVSGNPLNGTTTVGIDGVSGYVPATLDLAARWTILPGVVGMVSLQLATWSRGPGSWATLSMDVDLGLSPGLREGEFVRPGYRDTISPRVGLEVSPTKGESAWVLRAGYAFTPSPVPQPKGFASPADASTHGVGAGAGVDLGKLGGVGLRVDAAMQWLRLNHRWFDKGQDTLPFARYAASGFVGTGSIAVEGRWK